MKLCGIYSITHTESGRVYVGQSRDIHRRWVWHRHSKHYFGSALRKYGADAFQFKVLEECGAEILNEREVHWIKTMNCVAPNGFNLNSGGKSPLVVCAETRQKIGDSARGKRRDPASVAATAAAHRGMKRSDETRLKISQSKRGKKIGPRAPELVEMMAALHRGKTRSAEARAKMSQAMTGKKKGPRSEEWCRKLSEARTGVRLSPEVKEKRLRDMRAKKQLQATELS